MSIQQELLPLPTAGEPERPAHPSGAPRRPKAKTIDRKQSSLGDEAKRRAAALKACGIDAAFGIEAFLYQPQSRALECPAGKTLPYVRQSKKRSRVYEQYMARRI